MSEDDDFDLDLAQTIRGLSSGDVAFGRYELIRILGRGAMGVVWLARDQVLDREVALKFLPDIVRLNEASLEELKGETRRCLELTHPNIIRIYDIFSDEQNAAIAMEYIDGKTLADVRVKKPSGVLEAEELGPVAEALCGALHYAHDSAQIVHRDIKPSNVMMSSSGAVKLADFGLSRSISDSMTRLSRQESSGGTIAYMSPQQMLGKVPNLTDDIYSLGATFYELFTSKPPFFSGDVITQIERVNPVSMSERRRELGIEGEPIPEAWEAAVASALDKDPEQRPQSVEEFHQRLHDPAAGTRSSKRSNRKAAKSSKSVDGAIPYGNAYAGPARREASFGAFLGITTLVFLGVAGAYAAYEKLELGPHLGLVDRVVALMSSEEADGGDGTAPAVAVVDEPVAIHREGEAAPGEAEPHADTLVASTEGTDLAPSVGGAGGTDANLENEAVASPGDGGEGAGAAMPVGGVDEAELQERIRKQVKLEHAYGVVTKAVGQSERSSEAVRLLEGFFATYGKREYQTVDEEGVLSKASVDLVFHRDKRDREMQSDTGKVGAWSREFDSLNSAGMPGSVGALKERMATLVALDGQVQGFESPFPEVAAIRESLLADLEQQVGAVRNELGKREMEGDRKRIESELVSLEGQIRQAGDEALLATSADSLEGSLRSVGSQIVALGEKHAAFPGAKGVVNELGARATALMTTLESKREMHLEAMKLGKAKAEEEKRAAEANKGKSEATGGKAMSPGAGRSSTGDANPTVGKGNAPNEPFDLVDADDMARQGAGGTPRGPDTPPAPTGPSVAKSRSELFSLSPYRGYNDYAKREILKDVQQQLKSQRLYNSVVDGVPGQGTHNALVGYQKQKGLAITGRLDNPTLASLNLANQREVYPPKPTPKKVLTPPNVAKQTPVTPAKPVETEKMKPGIVTEVADPGVIPATE